MTSNIGLKTDVDKAQRCFDSPRRTPKGTVEKLTGHQRHL
jgi:hypothetical protein